MANGVVARVLQWIAKFEKFTDRAWYLPAAAGLAAIDMFVLVIPTDGILVSSVMLRPRKWLSASLWITLGSTIGATALAAVIRFFNEWAMQAFGDHAMGSGTWARTVELVDRFGFWGLVVLAIGPLPVHVGVIVAAVARMPLFTLFAAVLVGRLAKYLFLAWLASHAPGALSRIWVVRHEVEEIQHAEAETEAEQKKVAP